MTRKEAEIFLSETELLARLSVSEQKLLKRLEHYPVLLTRYFFHQIDWRNSDDPLRKQVIPMRAELSQKGFLDFCGEKKFMVNRFLIHRYPDRAVVLGTNQCFGHCRFCFRKRFWKERSWVIDEDGIKGVCRYLRKKPEVQEVIISGGDPLMMDNLWLEEVLGRVSALKQILWVRLASRALSFSPGRIDAGLVKILRRAKKRIWFISHFNHPQELQKETRLGVKRLREAGIVILNQTVLLKGINDQLKILIELFSVLCGLGVKPYYLFQCDPVLGGADFAVDLKKALGLINQCSRYSGLMIPRLALEAPNYGKLTLDQGFKIKKSGKNYQLVLPMGKTYFYPVSL